MYANLVLLTRFNSSPLPPYVVTHSKPVRCLHEQIAEFTALKRNFSVCFTMQGTVIVPHQRTGTMVLKFYHRHLITKFVMMKQMGIFNGKRVLGLDL